MLGRRCHESLQRSPLELVDRREESEQTLSRRQNFRFLAAEGGTLRCRLWANSPQYAQVPADETVGVTVVGTVARGS